jgi:hypothetical protein
MHLNKFSLITLFAILSVSFVNAQVDDNLVPRPGDDRLPVPGVPVVPVVPGPTGTVDDSGNTHTGLDDHGHNSTSTSTRSTPTSTPINSSSNAFKNNMDTLSLASVFAFFMF